MKNNLIISAFILVSSFSNAQSPIILDTIYANEQKNVVLFFPKPIRQAITGFPHFVFTYNREKEQYFSLLQAKPGIESNLLVVTNDGQVYSYLLKYTKELPTLNRFISEGESIGNEIPKTKVTCQKGEDRFSLDVDKDDYYQRAAEYLLNLPQTSISAKRKKGIKLQLEKMVYNGPETYSFIGNQEQFGNRL